MRRGAAEPAEERNPYPGLVPFTERDAGLFFGREGEAEALWERIRARRLLAVIGPSGAGKTSFLRAGVIPSRPEGWGTAYATPGANPALGLARALTPELAGDAEAVDGLLGAVAELGRSGDPEPLLEAVRRWRSLHGEVLLVFDQFEELFTLNPPEVQGRIAGLVEALAYDADVHVVLSLRDDFLIRCSEHPPLVPIFEWVTPLPPLKHAGLRRALEEPAARHGYRFEDEELVEEIVGAVEGERGSLPPLAFAVSRLWERRDRERRLLTRAAYREIGGVEGALARHAEATLEGIGEERRPVVREIFRNLVTSQGTRAVMEREELLSAFSDRRTAEEALGLLADARLLTTYEVEGKEGKEGLRRVEVAHESLLKAWPRLVRWRAQDEEGAVLRDQLRQAAHLWREKGRTPDLLWTGTAYREFALWRERYPGALTAIEEDFARAMKELAGRRRRRRRFALAATIVSLLLVLAVVGGLLRRTERALDQSLADERRARASRLVALGRVELDRFPSAALAYAARSLRTADTPEGRLLALEALWRGGAARFASVPEANAARAAFSPDGRWLAASGFGSAVVLLSDDGRTRRRIEDLPVVADPRDVVFESDGRRLLSFVVRDRLVRRFDLEGGMVGSVPLEAESLRVDPTGRIMALGPAPSDAAERVVSEASVGGDGTRVLGRWRPDWNIGTDHAGLRVPVAVDPKGERLVYGRGGDLFVHRLNAPRGEPDVLLGHHDELVRAIGFSPDGRRLASADQGGGVKLWSWADRGMLGSVRGPAIQRYALLSFDPLGKRIAWASGSGRATCVWDLDGPAASPLRCYYEEAKNYGGTAFHPAGAWLASVDMGRLALWRLDAPRSRLLEGHLEGPVNTLAFSPDSKQLASCARDGLRLWPLTADAGISRRVDLPGPYFAYGAAWMPSGREVVITANQIGVYLAPVSGGPARRILPYPSDRAAIGWVEVDPVGRRVAVGTHYAPEARLMRLYLLDLETGAVRTVRLRDEDDGNPMRGDVQRVAFAPDGSVLYAGDGGIRRWDPESGATSVVEGGPGVFASFASDRFGRRLVAVMGRRVWEMRHLPDSRVVILDLESGARREILSHGNQLVPQVATDPEGGIVVTADASGVIRAGSVEGGEPHLLPGHAGAVTALAVSPDGRWIASAAGAEVRLWPMPDLSKPPFHALPYDELMARLGPLTNLEVVDDPESVAGYRIEFGPFPGWKDVPAW